MSQAKARQSLNVEEILGNETRLNRIHRLFQTNYNVIEPSKILEPYLYLGNCISAQDISQLEQLGIRYILNVASRDVEICPYYSNDMRVLTIDLRDDDQENILRVFDQAFQFIDEARKNQSRILVHCSHGQSRSPAIVLAYLMRTYQVSLEQCLIHVIKARSCILPNDGFLKQLILYDRLLVERRRKKEEIKKSTEPIQVIPIQVQQDKPKESSTHQIEQIPIKRVPTKAAKKRQSAYYTEIVKQPSPKTTTRSHSAHTRSEKINQEQWNVTTYYPSNWHHPKEKQPVKYITEIYDKATNRYIRAN